MSARLSKIVSHAKKFGFFTEKVAKLASYETKVFGEDQEENDCYPASAKFVNEYGPFGSLMRANLIEQWKKSVVTLQEKIYPLEIVDIPNHLDLKQGENVYYLPRSRALNSHQKFKDMIEDNEIGMAQITTLPIRKSTNFSLSRSSVNEYLSIHYFCPEKKAIHTFNQFVKQRMRWWKQFANKQANFEQTTKEETNIASQITTSSSIDHKFTFGKQIVEVISLGEMENHMNFIECYTSVEQAMLTYLDDSLEEKVTEISDDGKELHHDILRLHPNLSPVKLIILPDDADSQEQCELVRRLSKEIKIAGIQCQIMIMKDQAAIIRRADAIGTPFCLKIDKTTLQRGIISLRHRDTSIDEYMHISEVRETLSRILKHS